MDEHNQLPEDVLYAMRLIVEWPIMHDLCIHRSHCSGCPYLSTMTCTKKSTEQILQDCADIFSNYFDAQKKDGD